MNNSVHTHTSARFRLPENIGGITVTCPKYNCHFTYDTNTVSFSESSKDNAIYEYIGILTKTNKPQTQVPCRNTHLKLQGMAVSNFISGCFPNPKLAMSVCM